MTLIDFLNLHAHGIGEIIKAGMLAIVAMFLGWIFLKLAQA